MRIAGLSFVLALLMILCFSEVGAYPIPPQTLRMLTRGSDLIVTARVERVTLVKGEDGFNTGIARLNILSVLKGGEGSENVDVCYEPDMVCPAPPHYEEGATVLAFLRRSQDSPGYFTVGLSYGAKSLNNRGIEVYSARIRELIEIEEQTGPNARRERLVEWLVRCAEETATRWEGVYDLFNSRDLKMNEKENDEEDAKIGQEVAVDNDEMEARKKWLVDLTTMLTEDQKRRLTAALYRSSSLSNGGMELIELVEFWGDDNMVPFLWSYLKAFKKDDSWEINNLMRKLATLLKNQEALELIDKFNISIYKRWLNEAQVMQEGKAILQQFIEAIERSGAPRIVEINNEPETPADSSIKT